MSTTFSPRLVAAFVLLAAPVSSIADTKPTHCRGDEKIYFNCSIKESKKIASICGAGYDEQKNESGYLQYRFGAIGHPEFEYPATTSKEGMKDKFNFSQSRNAEYSHYDLTLQFNNLHYSYLVHSGEEHEDQGKTYSSSITIWKMAEPCHSNCPPQAPYAAPAGKIVKVFHCANGDAGADLYVDAVIRLMTSPGRRSDVTLPMPTDGKQAKN